MSTNAYWSPVVRAMGNCLSYDTKKLIARRYLGHDGTLTGTVRINGDAIGWLEGLRDAGIADAASLIAAIEKHGEIEIRIE